MKVITKKIQELREKYEKDVKDLFNVELVIHMDPIETNNETLIKD